MTKLIRILGSLMAVSVLAAGVAAAQAAKAPSTKAPAAAKAPKTVDLSKYPAPVRATIEAETKNATIKGVSKETEKGVVQYEVETIVNGHTRDFNVDPSGKILVDEEEIALDAAPAAVRDALKPYAKVLRLEKVTHNGTITYEASVQAKNGKKSSLELDANGKPVKG
jgi:uncharacterized membrane protein YkoI